MSYLLKNELKITRDFLKNCFECLFLKVHMKKMLLSYQYFSIKKLVTIAQITQAQTITNKERSVTIKH